MAYDYDLIAIGGGSGGIATSNRAASYGARCLIVERDPVMGGTCVNRGCVPKKVMWYGASMAHWLADAGGYGFDVIVNGFDWTALVKKREQYIDNINQAYVRNLSNNTVQTVHGRARLIDSHTVSVGESSFTTERIVVATGGEPIVPQIPGSELGITSDDFFELTEQPRKVVVLGAGYIAVELAGLLQALGSDVTLAVRKDRFLRDFDELMADTLRDSMVAEGLTLRTGFTATQLERRSDGIALTGTDGTLLSGFDTVIYAIGRSPLSADIGLQAAGVKLEDDGYVSVDTFQETNVKGIFALGDITGQAELTPVAIAAGRRLADRLYNCSGWATPGLQTHSNSGFQSPTDWYSWA